MCDQVSMILKFLMKSEQKVSANLSFESVGCSDLGAWTMACVWNPNFGRKASWSEKLPGTFWNPAPEVHLGHRGSGHDRAADDASASQPSSGQH